MFVKLKKAFLGRAIGEKIDVSEADAKALIEAGTAEAVVGDPLAETVSKAFEGAFGSFTKALQSTVDEQLKSFATAQKKSRKNAIPILYGENGNGDPDGKSFGDWLLCVRCNNQKRLGEVYNSQFINWENAEGKAGMNTQTGTQGGYTVPVEFYPKLMQIASENSVVRPRATVIPMASKTIQVPCLDHTTAPSAGNTAYFGGLVCRWSEESSSGTSITQTEPTFKQLELTAYELTGYSKISNALMADNAVGLDSLLTKLFGGALGWYEDYSFLRGTGAGQPLGMLNWAGLIAVTRSGASAFALADAAGMLARLLPGWDTLHTCWAVHPTLLAKLFTMVDTASGNVVFIDNARDKPTMMLFGLPVVVSEKLPGLNTQGDVLLLDCSKYIIGDRQQVEIAFSEHVAFTTNQGTWRFVNRVGGRPWLSDKVTLSDASSTLSPVVGLAAG